MGITDGNTERENNAITSRSGRDAIMEMDWMTLISNVGFPIVVAMFVLYKLDDTLQKNTEALNGIKEVIMLCPKTK